MARSTYTDSSKGEESFLHCSSAQEYLKRYHDPSKPLEQHNKHSRLSTNISIITACQVPQDLVVEVVKMAGTTVFLAVSLATLLSASRRDTWAIVSYVVDSSRCSSDVRAVV